jgi:hypothetical protein
MQCRMRSFVAPIIPDSTSSIRATLAQIIPDSASTIRATLAGFEFGSPKRSLEDSRKVLKASAVPHDPRDTGKRKNKRFGSHAFESIASATSGMMPGIWLTFVTIRSSTGMCNARRIGRTGAATGISGKGFTRKIGDAESWSFQTKSAMS